MYLTQVRISKENCGGKVGGEGEKLEREKNKKEVWRDSYPVQFIDGDSDLELHQTGKPSPQLFESAIIRHCHERLFESYVVIQILDRHEHGRTQQSLKLQM